MVLNDFDSGPMYFRPDFRDFRSDFKVFRPVCSSMLSIPFS